MRVILTFVFALVVAVYAKHYDVEFEEGGSKYVEKVNIFKQQGVIIYDVPQHGETSAMKLMKDYNKRVNVLKDDVQKKCYVYKMDKNEPSIDLVEKGFEAVKGKFPSNRYWIHKMQMFALDKIDNKTLSQAVLSFCQNYQVLSVGFYTPQEAENLMMLKIKQQFSKRSKRRDVHIGAFLACTGTDFKEELKNLQKCFIADKLDMIKTRCDVKYWKICANNVYYETLTCTDLPNEKRRCVIPEHTRADVVCCRTKCML